MDDINFCRRYCKKCGQQQELFQWSWGGTGWWENVNGNKHNDKCNCQSFQEYKTLL